MNSVYRHSPDRIPIQMNILLTAQKQNFELKSFKLQQAIKICKLSKDCNTLASVHPGKSLGTKVQDTTILKHSV